MDTTTSSRDIRIFCDASERAYGLVAYLRTEEPDGKVEVAFLTARSRLAPRKQQSIPSLKLCAAHFAKALVEFQAGHIPYWRGWAQKGYILRSTTKVSADIRDQFTTLGQLLETTALSVHRAAEGSLSANDFKQAEISLLQQAEQDCFAGEVTLLTQGKRSAEAAKECDERLFHPEWVFAVIQRKYWIIQGREVIHGTAQTVRNYAEHNRWDGWPAPLLD